MRNNTAQETAQSPPRALNKEQQALAETWRNLVYSIVQHYRGNTQYEDLIQEGMLGLVIAAARFDPARGVLFSTYATYWIRATILYALVRDHGPVRIGNTQAQRKVFFNLGKSRRRISEDTDEAVAKDLGVDVQTVMAVRQRLSFNGDFSLDTASPTEQLPGGVQPDKQVETAHDDQAAHTAISMALSNLDRRERYIIEQRYLAEEPAMLREVGDVLGMSRERVRQLEVRALIKMRESLAIEQIRS